MPKIIYQIIFVLSVSILFVNMYLNEKNNLKYVRMCTLYIIYKKICYPLYDILHNSMSRYDSKIKRD